MKSQNNNSTKRGFSNRPTTGKIIRAVAASLACVAFSFWVNNPLVLLLVPFIIDIYYTKFIPWTFWKSSKNVVFRSVMEWVDAILFALIAVYFINNFFFQNYQIPTSSLEKSLLVGDYLFVSKMSYGPRVPNTPLSFPLAQHTMPILGTKSYIDWPQWEYKRLKGFGEVKRNDIVVFNFPTGDTVALKIQNPDFYTLAYMYGGADAIRRNPGVYGEVVYRPVDRRENYVKRAIGLPGDTLQIIGNQVYIDGQPIKNPKNLQQNYYIETNGTRFGENNWETLGVSKDDRSYEDGIQQINLGGERVSFLEYLGFTPKVDGGFNPVYRVPLTDEALNKLSKMSIVTKIIPEPGFMGGPVYPLGYNEEWTRADYGPLWIPKKGATIALTPQNAALYTRVINAYEQNIFEQRDGNYLINGVVATSYTFKMDYYWMMGDNRDNSADSRAWGFVPEDHVVGSPLFVWLSLDKDKSLFSGGIRFNRIFKSAKID